MVRPFIGGLLSAAVSISAAGGVARASNPPAVSDADARDWREDLRFMASEMEKRHRNLFHAVSRERLGAAVRSLDARIPSLARHQIVVEMARIVAMVGDGHTNLAPTRDPRVGFRTYPIRLYFFADGLAVRAASREHADAVGAKVVRIGSSSAEQAYAAVRELIGRDNEMGARFFAPHLLVMPEVLHALGLIDDMEDAAFTLDTGGTVRTLHLAPAGPAELLAPETDTTWM
ncbi:MAG TPA: hypothetical protein VGO79_02745, partial [Thermoanaerobaculia bacterium]